MAKLISRLAICLLAASACPAAAAEHAIPSCYAAARVEPGLSRSPSRAVFLLVDQTTSLDAALTQTVRENLRRLIRPGTSFTVATFSAFQGGHFTRVTTSGTIEQAVPDARRPGVPTVRLARLDACLRRQSAFAARHILASYAAAAGERAAGFPRSEIMASLKQLSQRVAATRARDRIVIVASDLLEHSTATSFYRNRGLKVIVPADEMRLALRLGLIGNFGGARVYVVGRGQLPPEDRAGGRDIRALNALESFWTAWFRRSNARVVLGQPDLVTPIQ
jgi:hypothetical protein